jgi:hypothetical protein
MKKAEKETKGQEEGILLNAGPDKADEKQSAEIASIEEAFGESIEYEEIAEIENSPINEPVKEGEVSDGFAQQKEIQTNPSVEQDQMEEDLPEEMLEEVEEIQLPPTDAPEQIIDEEEEPETDEIENKTNNSASHLDHADQHAKIAADSFIGIANNILEIGGGFFIKIKRKKSHFYFDELLERSQIEEFPRIGDKIDIQNEKNFNRIKLDSTDIALLRPILIEVLKNQSKQMTPEQQLAAVAISIAVKKGQAIAEIKAENRLFVQQLDDTMEKYCQRFEKNLEREEEILNRKKDEGEKEEPEGKKAA